jgi:CRP/FNR family transcriptional regulator, cyclic AMP receptor protein
MLHVAPRPEYRCASMAVAPADLATIPLFASLTEAELEQVATWFETRTAPDGVILAGEGATGYCFFVLAEGHAAVSSNGSELAALGRGDFFGEIAILGDGRRSATVTTTTPVTLFVMFGSEFRQLLEVHPEIAQELEAAMAARRAR